mmetsp:Transcript_7119/g.29451  ORF Transcript_7119/g.29451 Transcript_7119/m.29451 type:complete len:286 (+) Transcript_7119:101-958(+)
MTARSQLSKIFHRGCFLARARAAPRPSLFPQSRPNSDSVSDAPARSRTARNDPIAPENAVNLLPLTTKERASDGAAPAKKPAIPPLAPTALAASTNPTLAPRPASHPPRPSPRHCPWICDLTQSRGRFVSQPAAPANPPAAAVAVAGLNPTSLSNPFAVCSNTEKNTALNTHSRAVLTPCPRKNTLGPCVLRSWRAACALPEYLRTYPVAFGSVAGCGVWTGFVAPPREWFAASSCTWSLTSSNGVLTIAHRGPTLAAAHTTRQSIHGRSVPQPTGSAPASFTRA